METRFLEVVAGDEGEAAIAEAAALLASGRLVAFPTETVYGLGANALDPLAVQGIFEAKARPSFNPLIVHVPGVDQARALVRSWPEEASKLAAAFWPGPLTLVLPRRDVVPDAITAGLPAVALRVPAHPVALRLLALAGVPVAAPSANRYTTISPTTAGHVAKTLEGRIDAILDGGATPIGIESTVLDLSRGSPVLLRPGAVGREEIEAVIGPVARPADLPDEDVARPSPGMVKRHYAPNARVRLFSAGALPEDGEKVGVIARSARPASTRVERWLQLPDEPAGFARQLYGALHALEDAAVAEVWLEEPPGDPRWDGVRDRLARAAG